MQLREAVFTARARLKQAELEAEQWKEELRRLQAHSQEQGQQIHILRQERQASQEKTNRLLLLPLLLLLWIEPWMETMHACGFLRNSDRNVL